MYQGISDSHNAEAPVRCLNEKEQKAAAKAFAANWQGKGYEKGETQPFWLSLLRDVYGVAQPENFIFFEEKVRREASVKPRSHS